MAKGAVAKVTFVANAKSLVGATKQINKNLGSLTSSFNKVGKIAKATFGIFVANQAISGIKSIIRSGEEAVKSQKRLQAIFQAQGLTGTKVFRQLSNEAKQLSLSLGIEDEVIAEVQAKLALFGRAFTTGTQGAKDFKTATELAFDFEAAGLGDALKGAKVLGQALSDPLNAAEKLKKAGILLTQEQIKEIETLVRQGKIAEAQAKILQFVQGIIGGTAEATASASAKLSIAIGEIVESIGVLLLPLLDPLAKGIGNFSLAVTNAIDKSGGLNGIWNNYLVPIGKSVIATFDSLRNSLGLTNTFFSAVWDIIKIGLGVLAELFQSIFGNKALNDTFISTLKSLWNAFEAIFQYLAKYFLPILEALLKIVLPPLVLLFKGLIAVIQFLITVVLNVVGTIADFITFVARAIVKMGEWITQSKTVTGLLNFLGAGFSALKKFVLEVGKALGGGFIVEVVKAITGAIGKVWDLLNQVKDKIANFFKNLFNVGSRSDFSITTPNLGALQTTVDNNGSLVLPDVGSFMPQVTPTPSPSPRTIVKELPTKTTASASKASITNNYSVTVQALTPTPAVGKVVVDSIKQFQQRSGGALLAI
jgi:polyhydroxyalkanoate synthesis regulator phasin